MISFIRRFTIEQWRRIDEDCRREAGAKGDFVDSPREEPVKKDRGGKRGKRKKKAEDTEAPAKPSYDWRVIVILFTVAVSLALQEYYGERAYFQRLYPFDRSDAYWTLKGFGWWSGWRVFGYVVLPMAVIWLMPGERVRDYYISPRGFFKHLWIYVVLFLIVLPAVVIAAQTEAFYRTYPFYKLANRSVSDLLMWEAMYGVQFFSLEFFFRGFMLHGLRRSMGSKAIFVMIVPYCMIHFGKPFPETMGAIFAGIVLGTLAMRTKSIWGGVLIHVGVAVTMDVLALSHCPPAETGLPCRGH